MAPSRFRPAPFAAVVALLLGACTSTPMPTTDSTPVDLPRYMGRWHVIANVPYFAEKGDVAPVDEYTLTAPGEIAVAYHYRKGFSEPHKTFRSRATVKDGSGNHDWRQWLFGVIPVKYRIIEVAPDYSWALVGYPGRDLAWVFARDAPMDDALYGRLLEKLRGHGVDTDKLKRIPQTPGQVGQPGFAAPARP